MATTEPQDAAGDGLLIVTPTADGSDAASITAQDQPPRSYVVAEYTQVMHQGKLYAAGETFSAPLDDDVRQWLAAGWITQSAGRAPRPRRSRVVGFAPSDAAAEPPAGQ